MNAVGIDPLQGRTPPGMDSLRGRQMDSSGGAWKGFCEQRKEKNNEADKNDMGRGGLYETKNGGLISSLVADS